MSLETLVRKDMILWEETWSCVPSIVRALSDNLRSRTADEGLLRVPGNKQKVCICSYFRLYLDAVLGSLKILIKSFQLLSEYT